MPMSPPPCPAEFCRRIVQLARAGRSPKELAAEVGRRRNSIRNRSAPLAELAEKMGKRQGWIARVENDYENLTLRTVGKLAFALELEDGGASSRDGRGEPRSQREKRGARATVNRSS